MRSIIIAAVLLTGCASNDDYAQRAQDRKYNLCADRVHEMVKTGERVVWSLEIDACMGNKSEEYLEYQSRKAPVLLKRYEFEAR